MNKLNTVIFKSILLCSIIVLTYFRDAYAYLDPGTGSYFIQMLLAGILAFAVAIKIFWKRIVFFVSGLFSKSDKKETDDR
jgi:hypothetical protein